MVDFERQRAHMVEAHLARRGIEDPRILEAFRRVPREEFIPAELREHAYDDAPLPIGRGQTISQPFIVALTVEALGLRGDERVLEVGTGSGYAAAILGQVAKEVFSIERIASLADKARARLAALGYANVHVATGDGSLGWAEHAPYDAIAVAAGGPTAPRTLLSQLTLGGRIVIPIGRDELSQRLVRFTREGEGSWREEPLVGVRFVPLIGGEAWESEEEARAGYGRGGGTLRWIA